MTNIKVAKVVMTLVITAVCVLLFFPDSGRSVEPTERASSARWEDAIRKLEARDRQQPPRKQGIVFVGSSSIRGWDLHKSFPDLPVINEGFGGSEIVDSTHFADRLIVPHAPRIVVLYAGDNDIAQGKLPREVARDFRRFVARIHATLPKTRIVFLSIKPSLARWRHVAAMREANRLIREFIGTDSRLVYVDIDTPMLGDDHRPRRELFRPDGLHLNHEGYRLWASLLRPHIATGDQ